ncbi:DUF998 domain-containing protein [Nocardia sp. NPDC059240]|uniref:DUF998 domain-containing protein n=1 Tax=Nocardia sp. NPDC059240 TaxID=3346786 RepID=UPI0036CA1C2C
MSATPSRTTTAADRRVAPGHRRILVRIGAVLWVAVLEFFLVLPVVSSRWSTPYDPMRNMISDLGATTCRYADSRAVWVCSPWHRPANGSWLVAGTCLALGALLLMNAFVESRSARVGLGLYIVSGLGLITVGANPEDLRPVMHGLGAAFAIVGGEVAMIVLGAALLRERRHRGLGLLGVAGGCVAVIGLILMICHVGGPALGGLWERIAAFPTLIYAVCCGLRWLAVPPRAGHAD